MCKVCLHNTLTVGACVNQELEMLAAEQNEEAAKLIQPTQIKPLHKVISEHKDVVKIVIQLNSIISTFKGDVQESLDVYTKYSELWTQVSHYTIFTSFFSFFLFFQLRSMFLCYTAVGHTRLQGILSTAMQCKQKCGQYSGGNKVFANEEKICVVSGYQ